MATPRRKLDLELALIHQPLQMLMMAMFEATRVCLASFFVEPEDQLEAEPQPLVYRSTLKVMVDRLCHVRWWHVRGTVDALLTMDVWME